VRIVGFFLGRIGETLVGEERVPREREKGRRKGGRGKQRGGYVVWDKSGMEMQPDYFLGESLNPAELFLLKTFIKWHQTALIK
jgi:hypothetical protein